MAPQGQGYLKAPWQQPPPRLQEGDFPEARRSNRCRLLLKPRCESAAFLPLCRGRCQTSRPWARDTLARAREHPGPLCVQPAWQMIRSDDDTRLLLFRAYCAESLPASSSKQTTRSPLVRLNGCTALRSRSHSGLPRSCEHLTPCHQAEEKEDVGEPAGRHRAPQHHTGPGHRRE